MKRVVARYDEEAGADAAAAELRERGLPPIRPTVENPFFDPSRRIPEERAFVAGAIVGGLVGLALLYGIEVGALWIPRVSPLMTAGEYAVPTLGVGLGVVFGGFLGAVVGTLQPIPRTDDHEVAVVAPDDRVAEATRILRDEDPTAVSDRVTYHEPPGEAVHR